MSQMEKIKGNCPARRKWNKDEIQLLDYEIKNYCEINKIRPNDLTTKDLK